MKVRPIESSVTLQNLCTAHIVSRVDVIIYRTPEKPGEVLQYYYNTTINTQCLGIPC